MAFQIRDFRSISAGMINWMKGATQKVTDFNLGSIVRTMIEAVAAELDELYINFFIGINEAIPVSVYNTFGFTALSATSGSTPLRFTNNGTPATTPITVPAGTAATVTNGTIRYVTQADAVISIGQTYVETLAVADTPGFASNTPDSTIIVLATPVAGIVSVTNANPVINGRDAETDQARIVRFQGYISTLARGTVAAIQYGATTAALVDPVSGNVTEFVASAKVLEPYLTDDTQPIALVQCYIHNGSSDTSDALVDQAQLVINGYVAVDGSYVPGWKAAGVPCTVIKATDVPVNVAGVLVLLPGFDADTVISQTESAIRVYIQGLAVGALVVLAEMIAIIKRDVQGVYNVSLSAPTTDVTMSATQKATAGTVALTV